MNKKSSFEDKIQEIDQEIAKRRNKWNLNALSWIDFDDISQILRIHSGTCTTTQSPSPLG